MKAAADAKAAALAKEVKAGEVVVAKAQADLEASINVRIVINAVSSLYLYILIAYVSNLIFIYQSPENV